MIESGSGCLLPDFYAPIFPLANSSIRERKENKRAAAVEYSLLCVRGAAHRKFFRGLLLYA